MLTLGLEGGESCHSENFKYKFLCKFHSKNNLKNQNSRDESFNLRRWSSLNVAQEKIFDFIYMDF